MPLKVPFLPARAALDHSIKSIYPEPMRENLLSSAIPARRSPSVRPSRLNPTPLRAFRAISSMDRPFILGGAPCRGQRYSVTGSAPFMTLDLGARGGKAIVRDAPPIIQDMLGSIKDSNPFGLLSEIMAGLKDNFLPGPFPFSGGALGCFSYDLKDSLFNLAPVAPSKKQRALGLPLMSLGFYDNIYVYDHEKEKGHIVSLSPDDERAMRFKERIESAPKATGPAICHGQSIQPLSSNIKREDYLRAVLKAKEYIASGDIYQVNLSQRLGAPFTGGPFELYEALMEANPTPFSSYLDLGDFQIISNSPERLLSIRGDEMETCPIKGTRPRGRTPAEDALMIKELAANPKERAEHVMIVDLERNDLGMVALPGTVRVEDFQEIQTFSRLHHMVSTVRGSAPRGTDAVKVLEKIFPGGSITGAPKIRAMEVIEELETVPREIYTGSAGYIDFSGNADLSILIRTAIIKDKRLFLHVGGGIVADSDPVAEYDETILKAMDFLSLLNLTPGKLE